MEKIPHTGRVLIESLIVSGCENLRTDEHDYETYYDFIDVLHICIRSLERRIEVTKQRIEDEEGSIETC